MIAWLIRFLSVATTGNAQNPVAPTDGRPAETPSQRERPLVVDDSTAMAEVMRLLDKQSKAGGSTAKKEDQSDS
jgi:hypothetical protein